MSISTDEKPPRKFPLPCWGQSETLALIEAYRERWYALRRGYLRTADWDAVATAIAATSPVFPAKTSAQCRHKIEKLRQRYRSEKQRSLSLSSISLPSSWFFFPSMDSMENGGSVSVFGSNHGNHPNLIDSSNANNVNYASVLHIKSVGDRSLAEPLPKSRNLKMGIDQNPVTLGCRPKFPKFEGNYKSPNLGYACMDDGDDVADPGFGSGVRFRMPFEEKVVAPVLKAKKIGRVQGDYGAVYGSNQYYMNGFNEELPPGFRAKGKMNMNPNLFYSGVDPRENNSVRCEMNTDIPNGVPSYGYGLGKKSGGRKGVKRERRAIDEMISSIKLLGEGYVRTEKMKMEMAREMEKTRMEMELKRNELVLESQRQIIDACFSVLLENNNDTNNNKKKKKKETATTVVPEES